MIRGWALIAQGQTMEGIVQLRQGLSALQATGTGLSLRYWSAVLAEAYGEVGQAKEGLTLLAKALAATHQTSECVVDAELYRLKGTLTLQSKAQGPKSTIEAEVEEYFHKAINIARKQKAKLFELRAVTSLSRLWQQQGKQKQARQMLAKIYGWFTEGFDTADLKEAKTLLEELA